MGSDFFNTTTTAELWARLTAEQVFQTENDPFFKDLPSQAAKAVACLVFEALKECGDMWLIPLVRFENGVFVVPNNANPCGLTEPLKECGQYQELPEILADLVLWMVD
ncbi:MAG: hypothetical protein DI617_08425 [Streptococcus pyogenes]|nr:MAG: hypothetical protein DI617_08425 [Streptococcus pyogenes]